MTRVRAFAAAVPQRVWTAAAGLALLASLAVAAVIGAGLQVWRGAVGSTAQLPPATAAPPGSALVVVPGGPAARPHPPVQPHLPVQRQPPVAFVPPRLTGGVTPLVVRAGGTAIAVPVVLTARAEQLSGELAAPAEDAAETQFGPHALSHAKHAARHAAHRGHHARHRHHGRHR